MTDSVQPRPAGDYRWVAVWTKPRQELRAEENLRRQGFDVVLPRLKERRRYRGQMQWRVDPMFPRYLFVGADLRHQSLAPIRSTFGCVQAVWIGGQLAFVPEGVIQELKLRCEQSLAIDSAAQWSPGQILRVTDGPLTGLAALFEARSGPDRVRVLLHWLGQWQRAELAEHLLDAVG